MVYDCFRNRYGGSGIRNFISEVEIKLLEPPPKGLGIPVITILLEGGTDALYEVRDNLMHGQPCVLIAGSGCSADILA